MPKAYKKPHITMNRKKYPNKVRVVKQSKALPKFVKPSVLDLKRIYSKLANTPVWDRANIFAEAIQWYRTVLAYAHNIAYVKTRAGYSVAVANQIKIFFKKLNDKALEDAIKSGQYIAKAYGIAAPSPDSYLKKGKTVAKKLEKKEKESTTKYDKILTLLTQATAGAGIDLKVSPTLAVPRKFDPLLKTMFYSTKAIKELKRLLYLEGLLRVVLQEAWYLAREKAIQDLELGNLHIDGNSQAKHYRIILNDFEEWARTNKYAPKSLVRRPSKKKKKEEIAA